ncbi:MAG: GntR family transcriptional regulator [Treponema sp.]|jgi:GntR family transcriptional regulator|nr:GntR family transcriptional regulator [Treponema sp.]
MGVVFDSITLDKNIPVPLYYQLKKQILALIQNTALQEGDMIPPENELCELFKVSRPTIRQAFSELVTEGYLNRHKGKGTFVSYPKVEERFFSKLETFQEEMLSKGLTPHTMVIDLSKMTGPHEATESLGLPFDAPLLYLCRLRSANKIPLVYVETFLPYEPYKKLMDVDFGVHSLYDSLERIYKVRVNRVRREIEAINAPKKEAELLQITKNKALNLVKTTAYSEAVPDPVEFSIARYRGDLNKFAVDIYR